MSAAERRALQAAERAARLYQRQCLREERAAAERSSKQHEGEEHEVEGEVEDAVEDEVEDAVEDEVEDAVEDEVEDAVEDEVEDAVEDALVGKLYTQVCVDRRWPYLGRLFITAPRYGHRLF